MAANDAWLLQGMNGGVMVGPGQVFTGLSRGFFGFTGATFSVGLVNPAGAPATVAISQSNDAYVPGSVATITVTSGSVIAYPDSTSYTVT